MIGTTLIRLYKDSLLPDNPKGGYLNTDMATIVPLTIAISEIRDISKKRGLFSKSIVIPGNKNNNKLLNNYYDVNITPTGNTFDVNKLQRCAIIQDGIVILDNALLQLIDVNNINDVISYTLLLQDSTGDFFTNISNKYLTDINLDILSHEYRSENVMFSFNNTYEDGYKYLMPYMSSSTGTIYSYELNEFKPAIYARKYWDSIFLGAGYTYNWGSMNSDKVQFNKWLIPYNGGLITNGSEASALYTATANREYYTMEYTTKFQDTGFAQTAGIIDGDASLLSFTDEDNDPNNNYDPLTSTYTSPDLPSIDNEIQYDITLTYDIIVRNPYTIPTYFTSRKSIGGSWYPAFFNAELTPQIKNMKGVNIMATSNIITGNDLSSEENIHPIERMPVYTTAYPPGDTVIISERVIKIRHNLPTITPGDLITLNAQMAFGTRETTGIVYRFRDNPATGYASNPQDNAQVILRIKGASSFTATCIIADQPIGYNMKLDMNKLIPVNIKQGDFIKSILTMANLFVEPDKYNPKLLNIYSRDEYYDNGEIVDWSKKLCLDMNTSIKFIPEVLSKKNILTYKADEDEVNKLYTAGTNEIYGQAEYIFDNEYVKGTSKTELIFSPTIMELNKLGAVTPVWNGAEPSVNIRILYDGGELPCLTYKIFDYGSNVGVTSSEYRNTELSVYPYIGHWDKPRNPTFDLNFLPCDHYNRTDDWGVNTNNNLFNLHWRRTMNQINNGKIYTAFFNLNSYDISILKLNSKIKIGTSWWNINAIKDYDANSKSPTKVELVSIDDNLLIDYTSRKSKRLTPNSTFFGYKDILDKSLIRVKNIVSGSGNINIIGRNNYVTDSVSSTDIIGDSNHVSVNSTIKGDSNIVNSEGSYIVGDNNTVLDDISGVLIFGNGITASNSNTLYTNSLVIPENGTINGVPISQIAGPSSSTSLWLSGSGIGSVRMLNSTATGDYSHAEGTDNIASGIYSHVEGSNNTSSGYSSHSEGYNVLAQGDYSHAEGYGTNAQGDYSHAGGNFNTTESLSETVVGQFSDNIAGSASSFNTTDTIFRIGNGIDDSNRSDAFRVYKNAAMYIKPVPVASITNATRGMIIFNDTSNKMECYDGTTWNPLW